MQWSQVYMLLKRINLWIQSDVPTLNELWKKWLIQSIGLNSPATHISIIIRQFLIRLTENNKLLSEITFKVVCHSTYTYWEHKKPWARKQSCIPMMRGTNAFILHIIATEQGGEIFCLLGLLLLQKQRKSNLSIASSKGLSALHSSRRWSF